MWRRFARILSPRPCTASVTACVHEKHLLQAQCYALALIRQGFETVEAHFIRVERTSKSDPAQPQVVPYCFTAEERAALEAAVLSAYEARKS